MEKNTYIFYTHRLKTGALAIMFFVIGYIFKAKLLADTHLIQDSAVMAVKFMFIVTIVMGCLVLFKAIDPRPILEISPSGIVIQSFLFTKISIPWNEIESVNCLFNIKIIKI